VISTSLRSWTAAALLAVGLISMHLFSGAWVSRLFPELNRPITDSTPLSLGAKGFMLASLGLSVALAVGMPLCVFGALSERDQRRWQYEEAERRRLAQIEDQLWLESLPPEARERTLAQRRERTEREARARALLAAERQGQVNGEGR
jgi:hypothetical protein